MSCASQDIYFKLRPGSPLKRAVHSRLPFHKVCRSALEMDFSAVYILVGSNCSCSSKIPAIVWVEHSTQFVKHLKHSLIMISSSSHGLCKLAV